MKKIIGLICFAILLLAGCSVNELENLKSRKGDFPTFHASFGDSADETTKTYVDEKMTLRWTKDDRLSIFVGNTFNHEYKYDGETGANNGSFSAISNPEFFTAEPLDANYAIYPYNPSNEMSTDGSMSVILPSVQKYAQNSFGLGANTMVAATENKEDNFLQFKNLCGYVVVKLYGEGTVTSIKLEGNDGEKISGKADVQAAFGILPSVTMSEEATTSITLDCGDGVTLGTTAETATEFWLCVPPVTFSKGFTVTATKTDGWRMIKSTSSSKEVVRNTKNALTPIEAVFDTPSVEVVPPDNEIWYRTTDDKVFDVSSRGFFTNPPFNVSVVSNTYDNGFGIIRCSGPITELNDGAFYPNDNTLTELYLPDCVEQFGRCAIYLTKLQSLRIPEKLAAIEVAGLGVNMSMELFYGSHVSEDGKCVIIDGTLHAFAGKGLKDYIFPSGIKHIADQTCRDYYELEDVVFPEGLESIGYSSFYGDYNLKRIVLPSSLKSLSQGAFSQCDAIEGFYGNEQFHTADNRCLISYRNDNPYGDESANGKWLSHFAGSGLKEYVIPDGIVGVENQAFANAELDILTIPASLAIIEDMAFGTLPGRSARIGAVYGPNTTADHKCFAINGELKSYVARKSSNYYVIPDEITQISSSAFCCCFGLENLTIGDNVNSLSGGCFSDCPDLKVVTLSANLSSIIGAYPFLRCPSLNTVYFRSIIPPAYYDADDDPVSGIKIYVPEQSLYLYQTNLGWENHSSNFIGYHYTDLPTPDYYISSDYSKNGSFVTLQTASVGKGIDIVLLGDAYSDRQIEDGTYQREMEKLGNYFFSEEPYTSFRDCFNVYYVNVVSATEGYDHAGAALFGQLKYGAGLREKVILHYAVGAIGESRMDEATIVVAYNTNQPDPEMMINGYAFYYEPSISGDYGSGLGLAFLSSAISDETTEQLIHHEACGHAFAKLADEYVSSSETISEDSKNAHIQDRYDFGWHKNIDFTDNPSTILWHEFLSDERYANEGVGIFEGGNCFAHGVWRSSENSIMRYNTGGFNAPSRYAIWYRIGKLAYGESWEGSYEDFVAYDAINRTPAAQAASRAKVKAAAAARKGKPFQPLHEPVVVKRSWKDAVNNSSKDGR